MNVLLVTTQQQRADTIGAYGSRLAATPNLDRLAAAGVRFDACRTQNPYCQPSRATILTGRYPSRHGVCSNGVDSTAPSTRGERENRWDDPAYAGTRRDLLALLAEVANPSRRRLPNTGSLA